MADTNETTASEISEKSDIEAQAEMPAPPEAPDIGDELPQTETREQADTDIQQKAPAPDLTDNTADVSSNVTDGIIEGKQASFADAEKQTAEQGEAVQDAPAAEKQAAPKKGRGSKQPKDKPGKAPEAEKPEKQRRGGRPPKGLKEDKAAADIADADNPQAKTAAIAKEAIEKYGGQPETPAPAEPTLPRDATRPGEAETIVYITHAELFPFNGHPFQVRNDDAMKSLVESVKERGVDQPALVRPREGGGYELVAGHRRQKASELAGYENIPCIVRNMTDDEVILAMTESNFNQRAEILPSERAKALQMQLEAIKHQGTRFEGVAKGDMPKRSNEVIAERNKMSIKNVQRYIALNNLVPELMAFVDDKKMKFTVAVDLSYIRPKNQKYIAVAIDAQQSAPSGAQAQRMRELDQKNVLNGDVIDGIMVEEKKEETRVILNSQELGKYFGPEKSPREMKDTILKLLDEYKEKQPPELGKPVKNKEAEK